MVQKYIENPLLILNRKFDLRVWVVVESWNPMRVFLYKTCYLRFGAHDYNPSNTVNLYSHLTNNSVVKNAVERKDDKRAQNKIPGHMWSLAQLK